MATGAREKTYIEQLKALGIYDEAFDPAISNLAQAERDLTRAKKAWAATVPKGAKPSLLDPHYELIRQLRREILIHREALGLTPKALRRLRGPAPAGPSEQELICERLDAIAARVSTYDEGVFKLDTQSEEKERIATAAGRPRNDSGERIATASVSTGLAMTQRAADE